MVVWCNKSDAWVLTNQATGAGIVKYISTGVAGGERQDLLVMVLLLEKNYGRRDARRGC